jgi:hypothetical protein
VNLLVPDDATLTPITEPEFPVLRELASTIWRQLRNATRRTACDSCPLAMHVGALRHAITHVWGVGADTGEGSSPTTKTLPTVQ